MSEFSIYNELLKTPDTFCLLQTCKVQIINCNAYAYFNNNTLHFFSEKYINQIQNIMAQCQKNTFVSGGHV